MGDSLAGLPLDELRARRDDVRAEEQRLSYRRRLLHAQLDIVAAARGAASGEELAAALAGVLTDTGSTTGPDGGTRAVELDGGEDAPLEPLPDDLVGMSDEDRDALLQRLRAEEVEVSTRRRDLLDELDTLQAELVRRYRTDGVDVGALLGGGAS